MAIALEQTLTGGTDDATSVVLSSWTPAANDLILVFVALRNETLTPTVAGNGLTFVSVIDVDDDQGQVGITIFRALGASPSAGAITVTLTDNTLPAFVIAARFSGCDTSGTNGSGAIEATASATTGLTDNGDITVDVTTLTNGAMLVGGVAVHASGTLSLTDETQISINNSQGAGGGLIIGPSHVIERDVSQENILAMLQAMDDFGTYA